MAIRTKLNPNEDGNLDGLEDVDDLDVVYVENLKKTGLDEKFLEQFLDISKMLNDEKEKS